jgi:hypothetical protein
MRRRAQSSSTPSSPFSSRTPVTSESMRSAGVSPHSFSARGSAPIESRYLVGEAEKKHSASEESIQMVCARAEIVKRETLQRVRGMWQILSVAYCDWRTRATQNSANACFGLSCLQALDTVNRRRELCPSDIKNGIFTYPEVR